MKERLSCGLASRCQEGKNAITLIRNIKLMMKKTKTSLLRDLKVMKNNQVETKNGTRRIQTKNILTSNKRKTKVWAMNSMLLTRLMKNNTVTWMKNTLASKGRKPSSSPKKGMTRGTKPSLTARKKALLLTRMRMSRLSPPNCGYTQSGEQTWHTAEREH